MGSIFDTVGDIVGDIVEFAVDDILKPVFKAVGGLIPKFLEDPLGTILLVASIVPGPWTPYVWVARAALTAYETDGDLLAVAISAGSSYIGAKAGTWAGEATTAAIGTGVDASGKVIAGTVTERLVARAAEGAVRSIVGATISSAASGDFDVKDIAMAGFMGAVQSAGSAAFSEFTSTGDFSLEEVENSAEYADYIATVDAVDSGVADLAAGFRDLPEIAQEIIKNTAAASVTAAMSGGDVDLVDVLGPAIAKAAVSVYVTGDSIERFYSEDIPENTQKIGYLNNAINKAIDAAFVGDDIFDAFKDSVLRDNLNADVSKAVDYLASGKVLSLFAAERAASDAYTLTVSEAAIIADQEDDLDKEYLDINNEKALVEAKLAEVKAFQAGKDATNPFTRGQIEADIARSKSLFDARVTKAKDPVFHYTYDEDEGGITKTLVVDQPGIGGYWTYDSGEEGDSEDYWVSTGDITNTANDAEIVSLNKRVGDWITKNNSLITTFDTARAKFDGNRKAYDTSLEAYNTNVSAYTARLNAARNALTVAADNTLKITDPYLTKFADEAIGGVVTEITKQTDYERLENARIEAKRLDDIAKATKAEEDRIAAEAAEKARIAAEAEAARIEAARIEAARIESVRVADLKIKNDNAKAEIAEKYPDFKADEYAELYGVPSSAIGDDPDEEGTTWGDGSDNSSAEVHYLNNKKNAVNYEENNRQVKEAIYKNIPEPVLQQLKSIADFENIDAYKSAGSKEAKAKVRADYLEKAYDDYVTGVQGNIDPSLKTTASELTPEVITASGKTVFNSIQTDYDPTDTSLEEPYESKVLGGENLSRSQVAELKATGQLKFYSVLPLDSVVETDIWATSDGTFYPSEVDYPINILTGESTTEYDRDFSISNSIEQTWEDTSGFFTQATKNLDEGIIKTAADVGAFIDSTIPLEETKKALWSNIGSFFGLGNEEEETKKAFSDDSDYGEVGSSRPSPRSIIEERIARGKAAMEAINYVGDFEYAVQNGQDPLDFLASDLEYGAQEGRYTTVGSKLGGNYNNLRILTNDTAKRFDTETSDWEILLQANAKKEEAEANRVRGIKLGYTSPDAARDPWTDAARPKSLSLKELRILDPELYLYEVTRLGEELSDDDLKKFNSTDRALINVAVKINDLTRDLNGGTWDNPIRTEAQLTEYTYLKDIGAALISAGTEQFASLTGLVNWVERSKTKGAGSLEDPYTGIGQPKNIDATLKALNTVINATQSKKLKEGIAALKAAGEEGAGGVAKFALDNPYTVIMGIVLPELFSEIVPLVASTATGGLTYFAARRAGKAATAKILGGQTAFATEIGLAVAETGGGTYFEAFDKIYDAAIKAGQSEQQAIQTAHTESARIAIKASATEAVTGGLNPTALLSKKIVDRAGGVSGKALLKAGAKSLAEGAAEAYEESQTYTDIANVVIGLTPEAGEVGGPYHNFVNRRNAIAVEAFFAGAGVGAGLNILGLSIPDGGTPGSGGRTPFGGLNFNGLGGSVFTAVDILASFSPPISQAIIDGRSDNPDVRAAAIARTEEIFGYDARSDTGNYTDLDFSTDADGVYFYDIATEVLNKVSPDDYNTSEEVGGYYSEISADLGVSYDPSDSEILQLTGPTSPDTALDTTEAITNIISENAFTRPEALAAVPGYNFGANEVIPGLGVGTSEEQAAAIAYLQNEYIPPRQFTEGNLEAALGSDLFNTLTLGQKKGLIGQGDEGYNLAQIEVAKDYRNKREVTSEEATAAIEAEGYTKPDDPGGVAAFDAEVAKYVGVSNDPTHQDTIFGNITSDIDPRYIKESEARQAYLDLGITNPAQSDIDKFIGLGDETQLAANIDSYLPAATYNLARDPQGGDDGLEAIIDAKLAQNAENTNTRFNEAKTANETANKALQDLVTAEFTTQFEGTEAQFTALKAELTQNVANTDAQFKAAADERASADKSALDYQNKIDAKLAQNAENTNTRFNEAKTANETANKALQDLVTAEFTTQFEGTEAQFTALKAELTQNVANTDAQFKAAADERASADKSALDYQNKIDAKLAQNAENTNTRFNEAKTANETANKALQDLVTAEFTTQFEGTEAQFTALKAELTQNVANTDAQFKAAADERAAADKSALDYQNKVDTRLTGIGDRITSGFADSDKKFNDAKTANETANKALQDFVTTKFNAQFEGTEAQFTALEAKLTQNVANTDAQFKAAADERAEAAESLKSYEGRIVSLGSLITQNAENTDNKLNDARTASEEADAALQNLVNSNFQGTTEQYNDLYNQAIADKEAATAQFNIATDERATNAANALNYQNKFDTRLTGIGDRVTSGFADSDKKFNDARTASEEADTALQNLVNSNFQGTTEQYNDLYNQATANKEATTTQFNTAADERATAASDFDTFQNQTGGRFNEIAAAQGDISDRIGVRGREVTQSDLDSYSGIIDQQGQSNAPALTSEQTIYDVNNDGFVDITDQEILQQIFAGTLSSSTLSNTNPFASTGLQGQLIDQSVATRNTATQTAANTAAAQQAAQEATQQASQQAAAQQAAQQAAAQQAAQQAANTAAEAQQAAQQAAAQQAAQQAAAQQQTQTQIATAIANQQAADNQRRQEAEQQQLMAALQQTPQTTVETPDVAEIDAPYDPFGDSIFANENSFDTLFGQGGAEPMPLAAAKGGLIMDPTDEILRILGGR